MASGCNLWVWLECIGVVIGCCYKEVYRYPHNNYLFSLLLALFLAAASLLLSSFHSVHINCTIMAMLYTHLNVNQP